MRNYFLYICLLIGVCFRDAKGTLEDSLPKAPHPTEEQGDKFTQTMDPAREEKKPILRAADPSKEFEEGGDLSIKEEFDLVEGSAELAIHRKSKIKKMLYLLGTLITGICIGYMLFQPPAANFPFPTPVSRLVGKTVSLTCFISTIVLCHPEQDKNYLQDLFMTTDAIFKGQFWRVFTAIMLHLGFNHLAGNMMSLFFLGNKVMHHFRSEGNKGALHRYRDKLKNYLLPRSKKSQYTPGLKFLALYFGCGMMANIVTQFCLPGSMILGASGAINGLLGFLCICRPKIQMSIAPLFDASAITFLCIHFIDQMTSINGKTDPSQGIGPGTYICHISGLLSGVLIALISNPARFKKCFYPNQSPKTPLQRFSQRCKALKKSFLQLKVFTWCLGS